MSEKRKVAITYVKRVTVKNGVRTERELSPEEIKEWVKENLAKRSAANDSTRI